MSITRASRILLSLYLKLIETGIDTELALKIVQFASKEQWVQQKKEQLITLYIEDLKQAYSELQHWAKELDIDPEKILLAAVEGHSDYSSLFY